MQLLVAKHAGGWSMDPFLSEDDPRRGLPLEGERLPTYHDPELPEGNFMRGFLIALAICAPVWGVLAWLLLR